MDYHVAIPSYARAGLVEAHALFPPEQTAIWVPESQAADYRLAHGAAATIIEIPDAVDGNVARKRNWIIDHAPTERVLIVDDDVYAVGMWEDAKHFKLDVEGVDHLIQMGFELAAGLGTPLWGINLIQDKRAYRVFQPLKTLAVVLGPWHGHILPHRLRYDHRLPLKEDYDLSLQCLYHYRRTLRFDKYHYVKREQTKGGVATYRTHEREREQAELLQQKWGKRVVKLDEKKRNLLDMKIYSPLKGL